MLTIDTAIQKRGILAFARGQGLQVVRVTEKQWAMGDYMQAVVGLFGTYIGGDQKGEEEELSERFEHSGEVVDKGCATGQASEGSEASERVDMVNAVAGSEALLQPGVAA
jgi:hypothetical protein